MQTLTRKINNEAVIVCFITVCIKSRCLIFNWIKLYSTGHTTEYRLKNEVGDHVSRDRLITLTDGVLAIVMTLLVLEIAVPEISHSEVAKELPKRLLELWPDVWSYATSFIILGFFWIAHDDQFHYIKRANRTLLWITIFYLMVIAFIPFSTALIGNYRDQQISVVIYGINITIALIWTHLQWKYATKEHRLVDSDLDPKIIANMSRRSIVGLTLYPIAIAIGVATAPAIRYAEESTRMHYTIY